MGVKGEVKVILNQVNSSNPSQLKGYLEVAGKQALFGVEIFHTKIMLEKHKFYRMNNEQKDELF
nr:filamentous hemagglutinin N-terminal domain-containing protein [Acinetobacter bereziniae]